MVTDNWLSLISRPSAHGRYVKSAARLRRETSSDKKTPNYARPTFPKARANVITVKELFARSGHSFYSNRRRRPSFRERRVCFGARGFRIASTSGNFNGQNPFVLVPHINKKVAGVKTRKKRERTAATAVPSARFITSTLSRRVASVAFSLSSPPPTPTSFLFITELSCERSLDFEKELSADLQNQ